MSTVIYDLSKMPTTFDFVAFAVNAKTLGAHQVHFAINGEIQSWKYPKDTAWKRFGNIVIPICRLAGLEYTVGGMRDGMTCSYLNKDLIALYKQNGRLEQLKPTRKVEDTEYITVTLRDSNRNVQRNSNMPAWTRFVETVRGRGMKVVVLAECEHQPIDIEHRFALYHNAQMNLGVSGGPMALCHHSSAPYITINMNPPNDGNAQYDNTRVLKAHGLDHEGAQWPWRTARQILVWEPDSYENIIRAYDDMMCERMAA